MPKLFDRVKVNIGTTGTGAITFGAVSSTAFNTPSEAGAQDGDTVRYILVDGTDYEEGVGTIQSSVAQMSRTTVTRSKIGGVYGSTKLTLSGTAVLAFTASSADILNPANNLSDIASASTARANLGLGTVAVLASGAVAQTANNLSDIASASTARANLGLGGAAVLAVGATTGTVAAGDDSRLSGNARLGTTNSFTDTTDATSSSAGGAFTVAGGVAIAKKLFVGSAVAIGGTLKVADTTVSTSSATGAMTVAGGVGVGGSLNVSGSGFFSGVGIGGGVNVGLYSDGSNVALRTYASGAIYFQGYAGTPTLGDWNSARLNIANTTASTSTSTGALVVAGGVGVAGSLQVQNGIRTAVGYSVQPGSGGSPGSNFFNINYSSGTANLWIDSTNLGSFNITSDYRIKKDVTNYDDALAEVRKWRLVEYTGKKWGIFPNTDIVRHSFIAHELQAVSPDCVAGEKDGDQPQSLDIVPIIARLARAVQQLDAKNTALEARLA